MNFIKACLFTVGSLSLLWVLGTAGGLGGCGGGTTAAGGGGGAGEADVSSLSTVPSTDLSTLDNSLSSSASALQVAALAAKSSRLVEGTSKNVEFGDAMRGVGNPSRAGCETNAHKKEIFRMSQEAQLSRCYIQAMEKGELITISTGTYNYYHISAPADSNDEKEAICGDISDEFTDEKEACESGDVGPPESIKGRIGIIDGALKISLCFGAPGSEQLHEESTYSASGSVYTASVVHKGDFNGHSESSSFDMTVDLGSTGTVSDGVVSLGDGNASATAHMSGGFGSGFMGFENADDINSLRGAFKGGFTDPFTSIATSFTGKVYSRFSSSEGCAKFSFTGAPPPMRIKDMLPFTISAAQLAGFLTNLNMQISGVTLTTANYQSVNVCPNPNFDPANPGTTRPMVAAGNDGSCSSMTHTGVECFTISNGATEGTFVRKITQTFLRIADSASSFFDSVNAYDLGTLSETITTPEFAENWDCTGTFTDVDLTRLAVQGLDLESTFSDCLAIEEKLHDNRGMGGYNCHEEEQRNGVNQMAEQGPPDFGTFGGDYLRTSTGNCPAASMPEHLLVNPINISTNQYCFPLPGGSCSSFTVSGSQANGLSISLGSGTSITNLSYSGSTCTMTFSTSQGSCTLNYTFSKPTFTAPSDPFSGGSGTGIPQVCIDTFGTDVTKEECESLCSHPETNCRG